MIAEPVSIAEPPPSSSGHPLPSPKSVTSRHLRRSQGADLATPAPGKKTVCGSCGRGHRTFYDRKTRRVRDLSCGDTRVYLEIEIRRVYCRSCGAVKQEKLPWLANNPFYTRRFAYYVGRRCRAATVQDVARAPPPPLETRKAPPIGGKRE